MSRKPESDFIGRVHKYLPPEVYKLKMRTLYNNGVPDCYYDGSAGSLWVEYKYFKQLPKRLDTVINLKLTALQRAWITRVNSKRDFICDRYVDVRNRPRVIKNAIVVLGKDSAGIIITDINDVITARDYRDTAVIVNVIAEYITNVVVCPEDRNAG